MTNDDESAADESRVLQQLATMSDAEILTWIRATNPPRTITMKQAAYLSSRLSLMNGWGAPASLHLTAAAAAGEIATPECGTAALRLHLAADAAGLPVRYLFTFVTPLHVGDPYLGYRAVRAAVATVDASDVDGPTTLLTLEKLVITGGGKTEVPAQPIQVSVRREQIAAQQPLDI